MEEYFTIGFYDGIEQWFLYYNTNSMEFVWVKKAKNAFTFTSESNAKCWLKNTDVPIIKQEPKCRVMQIVISYG